MRARRAALGAVLALLAPAPAFACGHCVEDRAASVYDHGVVTAARNGGRQMAFYGIEGPSERIAKAPPLIARALASVPGVTARSLRISRDAAALSFSYDRRTSPTRVAAVLDGALAALGLRVNPLATVSLPTGAVLPLAVPGDR